MDHQSITTTHAVERYLLDEMSGEERDQFEAHFFDCDACAEDVRLGAMFIANSRAVFAENEQALKPAQAPVAAKRPWWAAVMRPAWGLALAGALAIFAVIRVATLGPLGEPAGVAALTLDPDLKRGGSVNSIPYQPGDTVKLNLRIEATGAEGPHIVEIRDASEREIEAVPVILTPSDKEKEIQFRKRSVPPGAYVAVLRAMKGTGRGEVVDRYYFTLTPKPK
jgi:hypothetical protein